LSNKVAIITGGAGGIGAATGLLFCEEGARVALVDSAGDAMDAALSDIRAKVPGADVTGIVTDVGRERPPPMRLRPPARRMGRSTSW